MGGATILFHWEGLATMTLTGLRRLLGMVQHTSDDDRYDWLNDRVCAVEGEVRPQATPTGFDVVLSVSEMVWEPVSASSLPGCGRTRREGCGSHKEPNRSPGRCAGRAPVRR
jgi:hypothetical protein